VELKQHVPHRGDYLLNTRCSHLELDARDSNLQAKTAEWW